MFKYVEDKKFLKRAYAKCADIVNQVRVSLQNKGITSSMIISGSKRRNMITQNEDGAIDFDFDLIISNCEFINDGQKVKETVKTCLNFILKENNLADCDDSTSVLTTKKIHFKEGNITEFNIDLAIIGTGSNGNHYRLIHKKTGCVAKDEYYWNEIPDSSKIYEKVNTLKKNDLWNEVRDTYLNKKNHYLKANDYNHPSFVCFIEAVNETFNSKKIFKKGNQARYKKVK